MARTRSRVGVCWREDKKTKGQRARKVRMQRMREAEVRFWSERDGNKEREREREKEKDRERKKREVIVERGA